MIEIRMHFWDPSRYSHTYLKSTGPKNASGEAIGQTYINTLEQKGMQPCLDTNKSDLRFED